jgi:putative phosphoesterase
MKILVISDTHGNVSRALSAYTLSEPVDAVIHLGDGIADAEMLRNALDAQVINVAGNCDPVSDAPREILWECEGKRIFLTHGDAYQVKSGLARLFHRAIEVEADIVLFGHTHQAVCEASSAVLLLNPGALANHVCHRSYAILIITSEGISSQHFDID